MTRYEPHCDCLGGHVSMIPDPNGRWCRGDDPRAVADDPSGIVQQMPEVSDETLHQLRADMTRGPWKFDGETTVVMDDDDVEPWICEVNFDGVLENQADADARAIALLPDLLDEVIAHRATEADLRAEVERLRAQAKGMTALLRAGCDLLAIESEALRNSISIIGDPDRLSDDPEDAPTIETIKEIEDWIASVKATLFPPALSPETDGGQDGA